MARRAKKRFVFDPNRFENKIYTLVTHEVNKVFSAVLKSDEASVQVEGVKLQRQIIETLHDITEEIASQILHGILINIKPRHKVPFYTLKN